MRKYINFKIENEHTGYLIGKTLVGLLSAIVLLLIYKGIYTTLNAYSLLTMMLLGGVLAFKVYRSVVSGKAPEDILDKIEFALLGTLVLQVCIEFAGEGAFVLSYLVAPIVFAFLGWQSGLLMLIVISFFQITLYPGLDNLYKIPTLLFSTVVLGQLIKTDKALLPGFLFQREGTKGSSLAGILKHENLDIPPGGEQSIHLTKLKYDIRKSLEILDEILVNNSIVLYLQMDDGLYKITDYISKTEESIDKGQKLNIREGYLGWALKTRTQVLISDVKNIKKNLLYYVRPIAVKSLLATPLMMKREDGAKESPRDTLGLLLVDSTNQNAFSDKEKRIATLISDRIVESVINYELSEKLKLNSKELSIFYEFTQKLNMSGDVDNILDHLVGSLEKTMHADVVGVALNDREACENIFKLTNLEHKDKLIDEIVPNTHNLVSVVTDTKKSLHVSSGSKQRTVFGREIDFALGINGARSILVCPLHYSGPGHESEDEAALGTVVVARKNKEPFNDGEISLTKIMCEETAKSVSVSMNYERIKELALRDGLTGLYNHRHFQELLSYTIAHSDRYEQLTSLILVDLDDLKLLNDTYGHQAGDAALGFVGELIDTSLRKIDVAARYGGDEFSIILPNTNKDGATVVADKIRMRLESKLFKYKEHEIEITLSMGIATYPQNATTKDILVERADRALYEAKREGKNKVCHYEDITLEELGT